MLPIQRVVLVQTGKFNTVLLLSDLMSLALNRNYFIRY